MAAARPPLSCLSPTGACIIPLSDVSLAIAGRVQQAHARYVNGTHASSEPSYTEIEGEVIPISLSLTRQFVARLIAWGASRVAFVRLSPDCQSNQLFPVFIAGELAGDMIAGVACVQILQD